MAYAMKVSGCVACFPNLCNSWPKQDTCQEKEDVAYLDNSLTSLSWLQNIRIHDLISPPDAVPSVSPPPDTRNTASSHSPPSRGKFSRSSFGTSLSPIRKCLLQSADFKRHPRVYRTNPDKPPYSYSTLIYLAIQENKTGRITLNEIYRWIKEHFKFYRCSESAGWQV